jgi:hypothetical protein
MIAVERGIPGEGVTAKLEICEDAIEVLRLWYRVRSIKVGQG